MQFTREINRLLIVIMLAFFAVGVSASYWAIVGDSTILLREDNPRLVEAEAAIVRGDIVDRSGETLVTTVENDNGTVTRSYLYPEFASALGYSSLRYGVGGFEAAYNETLRGDDLPGIASRSIVNDLLHLPQRGTHIQLTLDLEIQRALAATMEGTRGAAIVLSVPDGAVLAMVSNPTFDPNTLDANWDALIEDEGEPFFNRAVQGKYQPGGTLQTPLIAAALLDGQDIDEPIDNATEPVYLDNVVLSCAVPRTPPLSLRESYRFACPRPFARVAAVLGSSRVQSTLETFNLDEPPTLPGFEIAQNETEPSSIPPLTPSTLLESALGQGELTVSPLEMAVLAAAVINDGDAPQPYTLMAIRPPNGSWQPVDVVRPTVPLATANNARQLQDLMRETVADGAALNAARPNVDIGGHASLAYSGTSSQAWFIGFATLGGRRAVSVAVVLEDSANIGLASIIGGDALSAAHAALQDEQPEAQ